MRVFPALIHCTNHSGDHVQSPVGMGRVLRLRELFLVCLLQEIPDNHLFTAVSFMCVVLMIGFDLHHVAITHHTHTDIYMHAHTHTHTPVPKYLSAFFVSLLGFKDACLSVRK